MSSRADKLVKISEDARDRALSVQAIKMEALERTVRELAACKDALEAARAERATLMTKGGNEASFTESDAWVRSQEGRVARALLARSAAAEALAAAKKVVEHAMVRVEQMCVLRERAKDVARLKENRAERRAEDERLARRATTR